MAAAAAELSSGQPLMAQAASEVGPVVATFGVFAIASLVPILKGAKPESLGPLTPEVGPGGGAGRGLCEHRHTLRPSVWAGGWDATGMAHRLGCSPLLPASRSAMN